MVVNKVLELLATALQIMLFLNIYALNNVDKLYCDSQQEFAFPLCMVLTFSGWLSDVTLKDFNASITIYILHVDLQLLIQKQAGVIKFFKF